VGYTKSVEFEVELSIGHWATPTKDRLRSAAVVMASMLYSLIRVVLDAIATSHSNEAKLGAEVLALRRQVQVEGRQKPIRIVYTLARHAVNGHLKVRTL